MSDAPALPPIAQVQRARCAGCGTAAKNVTRARVGSRLPVVGDCQTCGRQVEITRDWCTKYHTAPSLPRARRHCSTEHRLTRRRFQTRTARPPAIAGRRALSRR